MLRAVSFSDKLCELLACVFTAAVPGRALQSRDFPEGNTTLTTALPGGSLIVSNR
jgi:hypothetical protein